MQLTDPTLQNDSEPTPPPRLAAPTPPPLPVSAPPPVPVAGKTRISALPIILSVVGVSLLLLVLGIGIVAAIAVPNIGRINTTAGEAWERRNAQNIASIYAATQAAGHDFAEPDKDLIATITSVRDGVTLENGGPFDGTYFGVPNMTDREIEEASKFLKLDDGMLIYINDHQY